MRPEVRALYGAGLKHHLAPILKAYVLKNMAVFIIFSLIFVPLSLRSTSFISEHDPNEEMYQYDHHPYAQDLDNGLWEYDYVDIDFPEEHKADNKADNSKDEGHMTSGATTMAIIVLLILAMDLMVAHFLLFSGPMKNGYLKALTRLGIKAGDILMSRLFGVLMIFIIISVFDLIIASAIYYMVTGELWRMLIGGLACITIVAMLYALSFGSQTIVRFPKKKRPMYPLAVFVILSSLLAVPSQNVLNTIIQVIDGIFGTGTGWSNGTFLMYFSPFHLLGEIFDWVIYGYDVHLLSFLWLPIIAILILVGLRSLGRMDYDRIHYAPLDSYLVY